MQSTEDVPSPLVSDDYFCGEEAPATTGGWILSSTADLIEDSLASDYPHEEEDEGVFPLEL